MLDLEERVADLTADLEQLSDKNRQIVKLESACKNLENVFEQPFYMLK